MKTGAIRLGIDIGGTFTDLVLVDEVGESMVTKVPSVPADPGAALVRRSSRRPGGPGFPPIP